MLVLDDAPPQPHATETDDAGGRRHHPRSEASLERGERLHRPQATATIHRGRGMAGGASRRRLPLPCQALIQRAEYPLLTVRHPHLAKRMIVRYHARLVRPEDAPRIARLDLVRHADRQL